MAEANSDWRPFSHHSWRHLHHHHQHFHSTFTFIFSMRGLKGNGQIRLVIAFLSFSMQFSFQLSEVKLVFEASKHFTVDSSPPKLGVCWKERWMIWSHSWRAHAQMLDMRGEIKHAGLNFDCRIKCKDWKREKSTLRTAHRFTMTWDKRKLITKIEKKIKTRKNTFFWNYD